MNGSHATLAERRAVLLERCQNERQDLVAMTAAARTLAPRARAWGRAIRVLWRLLRVVAMRPAQPQGAPR